MTDQSQAVAAATPRTVPRLALVATAGVGAFALTFCAALLFGRGLVGTSLSALLFPIAASGAVAVALVAAFGVATALEQPNGRVRVGRIVTVLTPIAAVVAVLAYAADPTTGASRALGLPDFGGIEVGSPRPQRTIGIDVAPPANTPARPVTGAPAPVGGGPAPTDVPAAPVDAPAAPVVPGGGAPQPGTPSGPAPARPVAGPSVPEAPRDKGERPAPPTAAPERPRQLPDGSEVEPDPRTTDPDQPRFAPTGPTPRFPTTPTAPADRVTGKPRTVAEPRPVESFEPEYATPRHAKAAEVAKKKAKPLPPACQRAKAPKRPAVCRNRA